jgi:hypothetical protein
MRPTRPRAEDRGSSADQPPAAIEGSNIVQATSTPKLVVQPPAALVALAAILFAAGIAFGAVMDLDLRIPSTASVAAPDTSYNAVEKLRAQSGIAPDTSYDYVESLRAQSGVTVNTEFDVLHAARAKAAAARAKAADLDKSMVGKSGFPSTQGISQHDVARGAAGWWASAPTGTVAGTPVSQADPSDRHGAGIR